MLPPRTQLTTATHTQDLINHILIDLIQSPDFSLGLFVVGDQDLPMLQEFGFQLVDLVIFQA